MSEIQKVLNGMLKVKSSSVEDPTVNKVATLRDIVLRSSEFLQSLRSMELAGKITELPFVNPIKDTSTNKYQLGGLSVNKEIIPVIATLVDETLEDSNPNLKQALEKTLSAASIIELEKFFAEKLHEVPATTGIGISRDFSTIVTLMSQFDKEIWSIEGPFIAAVSVGNYFAFTNSITTGGKMLLSENRLKLVPLAGMGDDDLVVIHPHGLAFGYEFKSLEEDRQPSTNSTDIIAQIVAGLAWDEKFVKRVSLS